MVVRVNGSTGIITVSGTSGAPSLRGPDGNSGISFDGDQVIISSSGLVAATFSDSAATINNLSVDTTTFEFSPGSSGTPTVAPSGDLNTGIYFPAADTIGFAEGGNEAARLDSSGRLLVGITTARSTFAGNTVTPVFQVEGTTYDSSSLSLVRNVNSGGNGEIIFGKTRSTSNGGVAQVSSGDTLGGIRFDGADGSDFATGALIIAAVDTTPGADSMPGRLSFSTTPAGSATPTERMRVGSQGTTQIASRPNNPTLQLRYAGSPDTSNDILQAYRDAGISTGALCCRIISNGNLQNTNGSYTQISDAKLKENIVDAGSQWDDLKAIQIRNWNFKAETGHETHRQIGPIAQELEEVCPNLVFDTPDQDEEGNDLGTVTKGVNLSVLYMKAVKALQEAIERIETLETANASLEARLTALESA